MLPWLLFLPLPVSVLAALDKTFGVRPDLISKYVPLNSGNWQCLDGSKEIPWSAVNDDFCDCPDGSDEPGTSACPNGVFYCQNKGHIGATISSTRVNDGLCEPECCDGSDERPGVCVNVCKEVGEAYRKRRDEERKIQKTGAKIRSTYIAFAQKEKKRLEALVDSTSQDIASREKEVARLREIAERTESLSKAALEHKKESPLYKSLVEHSIALKSLQREYKKHLEREKVLGDILDALRSGYNPNYQDMAVLEAVRGWEELAGLPHINDVRKADSSTESETKAEGTDDKKEEEELEDDMWTAEQLEYGVDNLLSADHVSLLLEHEEHIKAPHEEGSAIFNLTAYLPDSLIPSYEDLKDTLLSWLRTVGIIHGSEDDGVTAEANRAQQAYNEADRELQRIKDDKKKAQDDLADLFDVEGFGAQGEWKKLDGTCLSSDVGDYKYEVCLFGEAKQIPHSGGSTFSLGRFESWNPAQDVKPGEPAYYQKQIYQHGARCWNGPERNVILLLSCGTENALTSVVELEKCEYQFTATTPALCLPLDQDKNSRDEL